MAEGFTWIPVDISSPGHPDYETMRSEHLIASAIERNELRARGEDVGPDLPGVNVPDDWTVAAEPKPKKLPERPEGVTVPRFALALSREQAAAALNISVNHFDRHVRPHVREVKSGKLVRYPIAELERYMNDHAVRGLL